MDRVDGRVLSPNRARWIIQEDDEIKLGIAKSLTIFILLRRSDQDLFSMIPNLNIKTSGLGFDRAFANRLEQDPVVFDPSSASTVWNLPFPLKDNVKNNLKDFWDTHISKSDGLQFPAHAVDPASDLPNDNEDSMTDGQRKTEAVAAESPETSISPSQSHESHSRSGDGGSGIEKPRFNDVITRAMYTELWNIKSVDSAALGRWKLIWEDLGDTLDDGKLSEKFSWLTNEWELPAFPDVQEERQHAQIDVTEEKPLEAHHGPTEISGTMHTMCSLLSVSNSPT